MFDPTTGLSHRIEDIVDGGVGSHVLAVDHAGGLHARRIVGRFNQGEQDVITLALRDGTALTVTPDHRVLTDGGWRLAGHLAVGDSVARADGLADMLAFEKVSSIGVRSRAATYDLEVDEHHTFVADGVVVHNCSSPFRQAEFDIMYGKGISREGSVLDVAVDLDIVKKSGAWYTYEGEQLGQGRENAKTFLAENAPVMIEIYDRVRVESGIIKPDGLEAPIGHGGLDPDDEPIRLD
ncbi:MAG: hypothetical protein ACYDD7_14040 [Acidimicrobiales bacterium]